LHLLDGDRVRAGQRVRAAYNPGLSRGAAMAALGLAKEFAMKFSPCAQPLARALYATVCLAAFAAAAAFTPAALAAGASDWRPERNVEPVVGTAPGGGSDATARLMQHLFQDKKLIERPAVVVNKPGGGGAIAAAYMAQNAGNAHELLVVSPT